MFRLKLSEVLDMGDMSFRIVVYKDCEYKKTDDLPCVPPFECDGSKSEWKPKVPKPEPCETCMYTLLACDRSASRKNKCYSYGLWRSKEPEHNCDTCKSTYGCMYCDDCESYDKWWQDVPIDKPVSEIPNESEVVSSSHPESEGEQKDKNSSYLDPAMEKQAIQYMSELNDTTAWNDFYHVVCKVIEKGLNDNASTSSMAKKITTYAIFTPASESIRLKGESEIIEYLQMRGIDTENLVSVVRCRDCNKAYVGDGIDFPRCMLNKRNPITKLGTDYCERGERR